MTTQITTKTVENVDADETAAELQGSPLFDRSTKKTKTIVKIGVRRTDPPEGHLGYLNADATEGDMAARWGGGEFICQAKNEENKIVGQTTVKIAGDPMFQSEIDEARWRRQNNLRPIARNGEAGGSIKDVLALLEERESKRREEERERRTEERREQSEREERNRREAREHEEKLAREQADREERRRKDDQERDDRRRAQHREDLDRAAAAAAAQLAQTQQFFTQLQAMTVTEGKAAGHSDPVKLLTAGMELAMKMRGDAGGGGDAAPADPVTAFLARLPETLAEVRTTAKEAYSEIRGSKRPVIEATATPATSSDEDEPDEVTITGETARKVKTMIGILQSVGQDPEKAIAGMATHVIGLAKARAAKAAPAKGPPAKGPPAKAAPRPPATRAAAKRPAARNAAAPRQAPAAGKRQTKKAST